MDKLREMVDVITGIQMARALSHLGKERTMEAIESVVPALLRKRLRDKYYQLLEE